MESSVGRFYTSTWGTPWRGLLQYPYAWIHPWVAGALGRPSAALKTDPDSFPFKSELSLVPLLTFWAKKFTDDTSAKGAFIRTVREQISQVPELLNPITDLSVIERHRALVDV